MLVAPILGKRRPQSRRQGEEWFSLQYGSLMPVPVRDRVDFLRCESWKDEVWILGLPGQSLSFIQGKLKHALSGIELAAGLGANRIFGLPDLR